jgi:hypothetical protein
MFGTFQEEEEEPVYGITKPLNSWNPIWANLHYWTEIIRLTKKCKGSLDKIKAWIMPPGWQPDYLGGPESPEEIDPTSYKKYNRKGSREIHGYIGLIFTISLLLALLLLFLSKQLSIAESIHISVSILLGITVCGILMDKPKIGLQLEYARILILISGGFLFFTHIQPAWISYALIWVGFINLIIFRIFNLKIEE